MVRAARSSLFSLLLVATVVLQACGGGSAETAGPTGPGYTGSGLRILVVNDDGTRIELLSGTRTTRRIVLDKADPAINAQLALDAPVAGVLLLQTANSATLDIDSARLPIGTTLPVTLIAKNLDNGVTERVTVTVNVLSPAVVATGSLSPAGGALMSADGTVGIEVEAGQLAAPVGVSISTATTSSGIVKIQVTFDRDTGADNAKFTILPRPTATAIPDATAMGASAGGSRQQIQALSFSPYKVGTPWRSYMAYFTCDGAHRLKNSDVYPGNPAYSCFNGSGLANAIYIDQDKQAAQLNSSITHGKLIELKASGKSIVPVLFIHGYNLGGALAGGEDTWNDFPKLVSDLSSDTSGANTEYLPFEFRWRTDASFRVVADDLGDAIGDITGSVGNKKLRIIAHSFGGVLTRTLLQGLSNHYPKFASSIHVQSVLTLGTPHSGVFPKKSIVGGIGFPSGQDSVGFTFCGQVSCRQAGEDFSLSDAMAEATDAGNVAGGLMGDLASGRLPEKLPFVVGIGLKRSGGFNDLYDEGDGLISFNGQRFNPMVDSPLLDCRSDYSSSVREVILGADPSRRPDSPVLNNARGYAHSHFGASTSIPIGTAPDVTMEFAEPYVHCDRIDGCPHAALLVFRDTLDKPRQYCQPAPTVDAITPNRVTADGITKSLTLSGSGFADGNLVQFKWGSGPNVGQWIVSPGPGVTSSASQIVVPIDPGTSTSLVFVMVRVCRSVTQTTIDDCSDGAATVTLEPVQGPLPTVSSVAPNTMTADGLLQALTISGSGFTAGNVVQLKRGTGLDPGFWRTSPNAAVPSSPNQIVAQIDPGTVADVIFVRVCRSLIASTDQSCSSTPVGITVTPPVVPPPVPAPTVNSVLPTAMVANGLPQMLTINGSGFTINSIVQFRWTVGNGSNAWNDSASPITSRSALQIVLPMNPGAVPDTIRVRVCASATRTADSDCSSGVAAVQVAPEPPLPPSTPDVLPRQASFAPTSVSAGASIQVSFVVTNLGPGAAAISTAAVRINQSTVNPGTANAAIVDIPALAAGSSTGTLTVSVTAPATAGGYRVWVVADAGGTAGQATADKTNDALMLPTALTVNGVPTGPHVDTLVASPAMPSVGVPAVFTITGTNLPPAPTLSFPGCAGYVLNGWTQTRQQFGCTPTQAGTNMAASIVASSGGVIFTFNVTVNPIVPAAGPSGLFVGYYSEEPTARNPQSNDLPHYALLYINVPTSGGGFTGLMDAKLLACQTGADTAVISGSKSGATVTGSWAGTFDAVAQSGIFSGTYNAVSSSYYGDYTVAGGLQLISVPSCGLQYSVYPAGTWEALPIGGSSPSGFNLQVQAAGALVMWIPEPGTVMTMVAVIDEQDALNGVAGAVKFLSKSVQQPTSFRLGSVAGLVVGRTYIVSVTTATSYSQRTGSSSARLVK